MPEGATRTRRGDHHRGRGRTPPFHSPPVLLSVEAHRPPPPPPRFVAPSTGGVASFKINFDDGTVLFYFNDEYMGTVIHDPDLKAKGLPPSPP